jgi:hypothetical protein
VAQSVRRSTPRTPGAWSPAASTRRQGEQLDGGGRHWPRAVGVYRQTRDPASPRDAAALQRYHTVATGAIRTGRPLRSWRRHRPRRGRGESGIRRPLTRLTAELDDRAWTFDLSRWISAQFVCREAMLAGISGSCEDPASAVPGHAAGRHSLRCSTEDRLLHTPARPDRGAGVRNWIPLWASRTRGRPQPCDRRPDPGSPRIRSRRGRRSPRPSGRLPPGGRSRRIEPTSRFRACGVTASRKMQRRGGNCWIA